MKVTGSNPAPSDAKDVMERARFMAVATAMLFLAFWLVWFLPYDDWLDRSGTPFGGDYSMFYIAGRMVLEGDSTALYDQAEHQRRLHQLFPGLKPNSCLPYRYPPFVALFMAPLAALPYPISFALFSTLSLSVFVLSVWYLLQPLRRENPTTATICRLLFFCSPVVLETWIGGQASFFACAIAVLSGQLIARSNWGLAGATLALAAYKPNVLSFFAIGILMRYPRLWLGAMGGLAVVATGTIVVFGLEGIWNYIEFSRQLAFSSWTVETPGWKKHGLSGWLTPLWPGNERPMLLVGGVAIVLVIVSCWWRLPRRRSYDLLSMASLLITNSLFNPYSPIYDLSLVGVAAIWTTEAFSTPELKRIQVNRFVIQWIMATLFFGPHLSQALAQSTGGQLFSLWLLGILVWHVRILLQLCGGRWCEETRAVACSPSPLCHDLQTLPKRDRPAPQSVRPGD